MNRKLLLPRRKGTIGRCELCGGVDHHLVGGECPQCRDGQLALTPTTVPRESSRRMLAAIYTRIAGRERRSELHGCVIISCDSADNKTIRLEPKGREA